MTRLERVYYSCLVRTATSETLKSEFSKVLQKLDLKIQLF